MLSAEFSLIIQNIILLIIINICAPSVFAVGTTTTAPPRYIENENRRHWERCKGRGIWNFKFRYRSFVCAFDHSSLRVFLHLIHQWNGTVSLMLSGESMKIKFALCVCLRLAWTLQEKRPTVDDIETRFDRAHRSSWKIARCPLLIRICWIQKTHCMRFAVRSIFDCI